MHELLVYQIRKYLKDAQSLPPGSQEFLKAIDQAYKDHDEDYKRVEKAYDKILYELEAQSRDKQLLLQSAGSGIIGVNSSGRITFFNPAALRMLGYLPQELLDLSFHKTVLHSHPDKSRYREKNSPLKKAMDNSASYRQSNDVFWKKNNTSFPVDYTCTPVLDQENVRGAVIIFKNISKQINTKRALEKYARELEESKKNLEDFTSIASHDLKEPLRKIKSFGELLLKKIEPLLGAKESQYLSKMINASQRMEQLINHLLEFSRAGIKSLKREEIELKPLIQEEISLLEVLIHKTGGRVNLSLDHEDFNPVLHADRNQMQQLLQNLISNALKYHRPGVPPEIDIRISPMGQDFLKIQIKDNGIGLDESHAKRIFKPFERLHGKNEYEGAGMGLAICQKIITRHDGTINVISQSGAGSTFIVTLPIQQLTSNESDSGHENSTPKEKHPLKMDYKS